MLRNVVLALMICLNGLSLASPTHAQDFVCPETASNSEQESAVDEQTRLLKSDPANPQIYYDRALAYGDMGDYPAALTDLNTAIELDTLFSDAYALRGLLNYHLNEDMNQALVDVDYAIALANVRVSEDSNHDLAHYYVLRAIIYEAQDFSAGAEEDYQRARDLDATTLDEHVGLGFMYTLAHEYEQAIREYTTALDADPDDVSLYLSRGVAYFFAQMDEEAVADFLQVIRLDPTFAEGYEWLGFMYFVMDELEAALPPLHCAIQSGLNTAYIYRGAVYLYQGNYGLASMDLERAVVLNPTDPSAFFYRGELYLYSGEYALAIPDFSRAIELDPWYIDAYAKRGWIYVQYEQYEDALNDYSTMVEINPCAATYAGRAYVYTHIGNWVYALADYTTAIELDPAYQPAYYGRAYTYYHQASYDLALAELDLAEDLDPVDPHVYALRAVIHAEIPAHRDCDLAQTALTKLLELDQDEVNTVSVLDIVNEYCPVPY